MRSKPNSMSYHHTTAATATLCTIKAKQRKHPLHRRSDVSIRTRFMNRFGMYKVDYSNSAPIRTKGRTLMELQHSYARHGYSLPQCSMEDLLHSKATARDCDGSLERRKRNFTPPSHDAVGDDDGVSIPNAYQFKKHLPSNYNHSLDVPRGCNDSFLDVTDSDMDLSNETSLIGDDEDEGTHEEFQRAESPTSTAINDLMLTVSPIRKVRNRSYDIECGRVLFVRRVRFATNLVSLIEIPSHRGYTKKEKAQLYTSTRIQNMETQCNKIVWDWEGRNMQNVVEEDQFMLDTRGNRIHPAHWQNATRASHGRKVHFAPVLVSANIEVPSHHDYSDEEKAKIYTSSYEIAMESRCNAFEWNWEGRSVGNVVEEDQFRADCYGKLIHPVHWNSLV